MASRARFGRVSARASLASSLRGPATVCSNRHLVRGGRQHDDAQEENTMTSRQSRLSSELNRRGFLTSMASAALVSSGPSALNAQPQPRRFAIREDRFGRMFPSLPPFFRENSRRLQDAMRSIGERHGMLDADDDLGDGGRQAAIDLIAN